MKKVLSLILALALCLGMTPAFAAGDSAADKFPVVRAYPGFSDVAGTDWFSNTVELCYSVGLMNGTDAGFDPYGVVSVAEAAALSARLHSLLSGGDGTIPQPEDAAWYEGSLQYLSALAEEAGDSYVQELLQYPAEPADRSDFFSLLALAVPEEYLTPINEIGSLPDTDDAGVLAFYKAGILTGVNAYGVFCGGRTLTRSEMASMAARIARPALRQSFTPKAIDVTAPDFDLSVCLTGLKGSTPYLTAGGVTVTLGEFLYYLTAEADDLYHKCEEQGVSFHWNNTIGGQSFVSYASKNANSSAFYHAYLKKAEPAPVLTEAEQAEFDSQLSQSSPTGLAYSALDGALYREVLLDSFRESHIRASYSADAGFEAWQRETDLMRAKHILLSDQQQAQEVYETLKSDLSRFDELMIQYTEDAGTMENLDGYLFGPGEMVPEFEAAVQALAPGELAAPVKSDYGYHIILRLPLELESYQNEMFESAYHAFIAAASADLSKDSAEGPAFAALDLNSYYETLAALRDQLPSVSEY